MEKIERTEVLTEEEQQFIEEYLEELEHPKKEIKPFDGKLTEEELKNLKEANFSDKEIQMIEYYVYKYRDHLTSFVDFIGDRNAPSRKFLYNLKHYGYLLEDDPKKVITKKDVLVRKLLYDKAIKLIGPSQLKNKQIFENRNFLKLNPRDYPKDTDLKTVPVAPDLKIKLPDRPVIWVPNHHFKDDVLCSYLATKRQAYILFGSMPQFYNTFDGVLADKVGALMTNRKVASSKHASVQKAIYAQELNADVLCFAEGVWDKYPNELLLQFWNGVYYIAKENGSPFVPIINYIFDPTLQIAPELNPIHTVIDDPIDISGLSEKASLSYIREVIAAWYYLMMEKYGEMTRENLMKFYEERALHYNDKLTPQNFDEKKITSHEAFEVYLLDLLQTVDWYDSEIELSYDFRPKDIARPEDVFAPIANIKNVSSQNMNDVAYAKELIRVRKMEDYQRRF